MGGGQWEQEWESGVYDHRRSGIILGDGNVQHVVGKEYDRGGMEDIPEKQTRTKRHNWVIKSFKLTGELGKGRRAESVSSC